MLKAEGLEDAIEDSSDEEIVFVGRGGRMLDTPPSPKVTYRRQDRAEFIEVAKEREEEEVQREKLVFESLAEDRGASFGYVALSVGFPLLPIPEMFILLRRQGRIHNRSSFMADIFSCSRYLVHSIATYYNLQTWSVTVGDPARREAYVGIKLRSGERQTLSGEGSPEMGLPRPLWGMV